MEGVDARSARLRGYLAADSSNVELACELVDALLGEGKPDEAATVLLGMAGDSANAAPVRFRLARLALLKGDYAAAENLYRQLIADGDEGAGVWHDMAFSQLCQRRADDASDTIRAGIERTETDPALFVLQARIELMRGDFPAAFVALDRALELDSTNAAALGVQALALLDSNVLDHAAMVANNCLARYPDQHEALLVAGTLALWAQQLDAAKVLFECALARLPNSGRALSGYGQMQMLRNELPDARSTLERAVVAMPDHIGTWHALAWTQLLLGDRTAAEASYRSAFALDRNFGDSHGGLALIDALNGRLDEAEQGIKRALRLDPNAVTARYAKTLVLEARGEIAESQQLMSSLIGQTGPAASMPVGEFAARLKATLGADSR